MGIKGFIKGVGKAAEALSPGHHVANAINDTPKQAVAKAANGDESKIKELSLEHDKFIPEADIELSHTGSFQKGLGMGFINSLAGGDIVGGRLHNNIGKILANGGTHAEFVEFKEAARDPRETVANGAQRADNLNVTIKDYADFCETASKAIPEQRDDISRFVIKNLKHGYSLQAITDAVEAGFKGNNKETSLNERAEKQLKDNQPQGNMENALAQAENIRINAALASDSTTLGVSHGDPNIGRGTQPAPSNDVVLS